MACSPNTTNLLGRRALVRVLFGIAASGIAGGAAAGHEVGVTTGCPEPDAQLFARWREYLNSEIELFRRPGT